MSGCRLYYWPEGVEPLELFERIQDRFLHPEANPFLALHLDGSDCDSLRLERLNLDRCQGLLTLIAPLHGAEGQRDILPMPQSYNMVIPVPLSLPFAIAIGALLQWLQQQ